MGVLPSKEECSKEVIESFVWSVFPGLCLPSGPLSGFFFHT